FGRRTETPVAASTRGARRAVSVHPAAAHQPRPTCGGTRMNVLYPISCGLDVHKKEVVACLLEQSDGATARREIRRFGTMTADLLELFDWLRSTGCTHV